MAKKEDNPIDLVKKDVLTSIRKIMSDLEKERLRLVEKEKFLQKYEKDLQHREKLIEKEMEIFSNEISDMVSLNPRQKADSKQ